MLKASCFAMLLCTLVFSSPLSAQGHALKLGPGEEYVAGNNSHLPQGNSPRTLEAWVNSDSDSIQTIFNYGNVITNERMGILLHSGRLYVVGQYNDIHGFTNIPKNTWTHVAATYDQATVSLYVNGVLDRSAPFPAGSHNATGTQWRIGMGVDTAPGVLFEPFTGLIDEVRVWNVARSAGEIAGSMNGCIYDNPGTLVAYYRLDDGPNSNTASDRSASNATGTLVNMDPSLSWATPAPVTCSDSYTKLVGLEVVQVVQDWKNTAQLAAGKSTMVRAHIADPQFSTPPGLTFRLRAFGGANLDQPLVPAFVNNVQGTGNQQLLLPPSVNENTRATKRASANFWLPAGWTTAGPKRFVVESDSATLLDCQEQAGPTPNDCSATVEFRSKEPIVLHLVRTRFKTTAGVVYETGHGDLVEVCSQVQRRFPTGTVVCVNEPNPIVFPDAPAAPTSADILGETDWRKTVTNLCVWPICEDFYVSVTRFPSSDGAVGRANFPRSSRPWSRSAWAVDVNIDPSAAPHEIGHTLDLNHTTKTEFLILWSEGTCKEKAEWGVRYPPGNSFPFPYYSGDDPLLGPVNDAQALVLGYDAATDAIIPHTENALMSYCGTTLWPDIGSYNKLAQDLDVGAAPLGSSPVPNVDEYYLVTGTVDVLTDAAEFDPLEVLVPPYVPVAPPAGEWELLVHFATGPDVTHPLDLGYSPNEPTLAAFSAFVPFDPDVTGFTIQRSGAPLADLTASNNAPAIQITAPAPGTQFTAENLVLEWNATDADNDTLNFVVEYSPDGGVTWANLSVNWPGSPFTVFSDLIQPSQNALFRVTALDGFHSTTATLDGTVVVDPPALIFEDRFE